MVDKPSTNKDLLELKKLWQDAFDDTETYVDFYFSSRYKHEYTYVYREQEKNCVASAAQFFPYEISYGKEIFKSVYSLGVCTDKQFRKQGFVSAIFNTAMLDISKNTDIMFLIPQEQYLFDIYRKLGFCEAFYVYEANINSVLADKCATNFPNKFDEQELFELYNKLQNQLKSCVLKSFDDFIFMVRDLQFYGSSFLIAENGFAVLEHTPSPTIKELLCSDFESYNDLINQALSLHEHVKINLPNNRFHASATKKTLGMCRILNAQNYIEKMIKNEPCENISVKITDPILPQNNGTYIIKNNSVKFQSEAPFDLALDISVVPQFFNHNSYANLLMN